MNNRTVGRSVANLVLALTNATLILVALCAWLAWHTFATAERVSDNIVRALSQSDAFRSDIANLSTEISGLRKEIAALQSSDDSTLGRSSKIATEVDALRSEVAALTSAIEGLSAHSQILIQHAVETTFDEFGRRVAQFVPRLGAISDPAASVPLSN